MFAYPLPSIPTHFQPILIENQSNPIGIDPKSEFSLRFYPTNDINEQDPYVENMTGELNSIVRGTLRTSSQWNQLVDPAQFFWVSTMIATSTSYQHQHEVALIAFC